MRETEAGGRVSALGRGARSAPWVARQMQVGQAIGEGGCVVLLAELGYLLICRKGVLVFSWRLKADVFSSERSFVFKVLPIVVVTTLSDFCQTDKYNSRYTKE